jgi:hypothetical protein
MFGMNKIVTNSKTAALHTLTAYISVMAVLFPSLKMSIRLLLRLLLSFGEFTLRQLILNPNGNFSLKNRLLLYDRSNKLMI